MPLQQIKKGWVFVRQNDLPTILRQFNSKDTHPFLQFLKYGFCGVLAVAVHNGLFAVLSYWINPAIDRELGDSVRAVRATVNNIIAFLFSNFTAYYSNAKWVFTQGRHHPVKEFFFFTAVSVVSFSLGVLLVPLLIKGFAIHTWLAQGAFVLTSALINYICRKFLVFQK